MAAGAASSGERATQAVPGAGPQRRAAHARRRAAGRRGGPRGPAVRRARRQAAATAHSRTRASTSASVYVTNAVKHFSFEPRGKRRIHKTPAQRRSRPAAAGSSRRSPACVPGSSSRWGARPSSRSCRNGARSPMPGQAPCATRAAPRSSQPIIPRRCCAQPIPPPVARCGARWSRICAGRRRSSREKPSPDRVGAHGARVLGASAVAAGEARPWSEHALHAGARVAPAIAAAEDKPRSARKRTAHAGCPSWDCRMPHRRGERMCRSSVSAQPAEAGDRAHPGCVVCAPRDTRHVPVGPILRRCH